MRALLALLLCLLVTHAYAGSMDEPEKRIPINGRVLQVIEEGLLVYRVDGSTVLLEGFPKKEAAVDEAVVITIASPLGSLEYTTTSGTTKRVARYKYISGTVTNP